MCCMRLAENTGRKKSPTRHLRAIAQLCRAVSWQLRHVSTVGNKLVKQQYLLHMLSQHDELRPISGWDRFTSLGHPSIFQQVSRVGFVTTQTSLNGRQPNFAQCLAVSWLVHYICIFSGSSPLREFCQVQNSLCVQVLHYPTLVALLRGTGAVSVSQTLLHGMFARQGGHPVRHWTVELSSCLLKWWCNENSHSSGKLVTLVCQLSPTKWNRYPQKSDLVVKTEPYGI